MTFDTETFQGHIDEREPRIKRFVPSLDLQPFCRFIEESDWDEVLTREEWGSRICLGVMVVTFFYFTPPVLMMLFAG